MADIQSVLNHIFIKAPEKHRITEQNDRKNINTSSILSKLIVDTGRFAEHYASDLFISWQSVLEKLKQPVTEYRSEIIVFAIRKCGVDHLPFFQSHIKNNKKFCYEQIYYRRIYFLKIELWPDDCEKPNCKLTLNDMTTAMTTKDYQAIADADEN